jgi:hypothetical protein
MRRHEFPLEEILAELQGTDFALEQQNNDWQPGFEGDRRVVLSKFGPFVRCYRKPKKYIKRYWHSVYSLPIENWQIALSKQLFGGFCSIDAKVDLRIQASYKFALANMVDLANINKLIKSNFEGLILDLLEQALGKLEDGEWIKSGLNEAKQQIETTINETLIVQNIQCRAIVELEPTFARISEVDEFDEHFIRKSVYLDVMRQNFAFREQQKQEWFRQQDSLAEQALEHKTTQLQLLEKEGELLCLQQAKEAENQQRLLRESGTHKQTQLETERQIHEQDISHQSLIQEMEYQEEIKERKKKQLINQQTENALQESSMKHDISMNETRMSHERLLKEQELEFEIEEFEKRQTRWNSAEFEQQSDKIKQEKLLKEQELEANILEQESREIAQQKLQERIKEQQINHERRLRAMQLDAEQQTQLERYKATQNSDHFIQREIDLLTLEKQKVELNKEIKFAEILLNSDK